MGAHTIIDLIAGLVLSMGIIGVYLLVGDAVDTFLATSPWVPLVVPAVAIALLYIYPYNNIWSESYGDTACFLGEPLLTHIHNKAHLPLPFHLLLCSTMICPGSPDSVKVAGRSNRKEDPSKQRSRR